MSHKEKEVQIGDEQHWMQRLWRPAMGWMYMLICTADMLIFPVLWSLWQAFNHQPITQWNPLTLQGAGLFHIAMGAVLGISAFGRTQEKIAGTASNSVTETVSVTSTAPAVSAPVVPVPTFSAPAASGLPVSSTGHKIVPATPMPAK
jgi:hypothetical protein